MLSLFVLEANLLYGLGLFLQELPDEGLRTASREVLLNLLDSAQTHSAREAELVWSRSPAQCRVLHAESRAARERLH